MIRPEIRQYTPEDIDAVHSIALASAEADGVDPKSTLENIPTLGELTESLGTGSSPDVLVAVDPECGGVVGYGSVRYWEEDGGQIVYVHSGKVHPNHRRQGVGTGMLEALEARIHELEATHNPDAPKVVGANSTESEAGKPEMFIKNGYEKVYAMVEMELVDPDKLPVAVLADGFEFKTCATLNEKRKIYDANKEVYDGVFGSSPKSDEDFEEFLDDNPDSSSWHVVWAGDEVAGFVISEKRDDGSAEIMEVTVVPKYRRRGLAGYLMAHSIHTLQNDGVKLIRLHTDADGKQGGRQLYENIGFKALKEHYRFRKPLEKNEQDNTDILTVSVETLQGEKKQISISKESVSGDVELDSGEPIHFKPLGMHDVETMALFLSGLSEETRRLSSFEGYDHDHALELCESIGKYDKMRFVATTDDGNIVGVIEYSFGIPGSDVERYKSYGIILEPGKDCRFGITLADDYQSKKLGRKISGYIDNVAVQASMSRVILWGGVLAENTRAISYYTNKGFIEAGRFTREDGVECVDMIKNVT
jgi:mycothiol synthase